MNPDLPPLDKDVLEKTPPIEGSLSAGKPAANANQPLSEKDFIQNKPLLTSFPFWLWLFIIAALAAILWGSKGWYGGFLQQEKEKEPFLEVTNREFSLFLWQFPSFLPVHAPKKNGYLPGFLSDSENFSPATAEDFVSAPPDLIFLYHTWQRLLAPDFIPQPINPTEFTEFLEELKEWQPRHWTGAPLEYTQLIESKGYVDLKDLQTLPLSTLPLMVRQAFQGWKNYFKEGAQINEIHPTFAQVTDFLKEHPTYARNYWRNIQEVNGQNIAGLNYLSTLWQGSFKSDEEIPADQLAPFLKVALFNSGRAVVRD